MPLQWQVWTRDPRLLVKLKSLGQNNRLSLILMKPSGSLQLSRFLETIRTNNTIRTNICVLGDPGVVSRVGRKGGTKVFKYGWTHRTISKNSSRCQLLIGYKKCFVLLCRISEQSLLSSFREFEHDDYCLDHGLSGTCTKEMHTVRKLSVWYKIPIWF